MKRYHRTYNNRATYSYCFSRGFELHISWDRVYWVDVPTSLPFLTPIFPGLFRFTFFCGQLQ